MARKKEFDQEQALERALELFWTKGYERTSIQDLCDHLGIHRGSLYDTFGDKHQLFLACLDRYREIAENDVFSILSEPGSSKELLERFFTKIIDISMNYAERRGCFMANTAMGVAPFDPNVASRVEAISVTAETAFYRFLVRAQKNGELKGKNNIRAIARFLVNTMQGLHVMAKTSPDRSVLEDVCKIALTFII
jgi:TetR/AcrR family transcriptional regulator, transcriptional repressor for nem operon